jgi:hypothetical protein
MIMPRLSRRQFTVSAGAGLVLAPFLSLLRGGDQPARAAGKQAKRLLLFCTMGTNTDMWSPSGGETSFTFSAMAAIKPALPPPRTITLLMGVGGMCD